MSQRKQAGANYPCGLVRREALWQMGGGFAGVALAAMLDQDGFFQQTASAASPPTTRCRRDQLTSPPRPRAASFC